MRLVGRIFTSVLGVGLIWFAVTMALSPDLIIPIAKHGEMPERVPFEPNLTTEIARYVSAGLLAFFGLTLAVAPWRRREEADESSA